MISVVVDDLAFIAADAVLRPADDRLDPVTPAMARMDQQAGAAFAAQRRVSSPLQVGAAVVTGGGDLTASFVVHLVLQSQDEPAAPDAIRRALASAWHRAREWGLARVAAPLIGAGAGRMDPEEAAELLIETFTASGDPSGSLTIVVEREVERELVEAVVQRSRL